MTSPDRPRSPADVPHGDPALDPPLSIRVHPDDDPRDPQARRVVKSDDRDDDEPWHLVTGLNQAWGSEFYRRDEFVADWPRQDWQVAATVFRHAEHAEAIEAALFCGTCGHGRAIHPDGRCVHAGCRCAGFVPDVLDGTDVAATPFRMGER